MGRKPKKKDIAEYLWHSEPTKINATNDNWRIRYGYLDSEGKEHQTTETVNNERAKNQFLSYLLLREKEHKATKGTTVASKVDKTEIETVEQLLYAYAEHTKYLHTIGDRYGWDEGTYRANIGKIRNYIVPVFGSFPIWKITRVDMDVLTKWLTKVKCSGIVYLARAPYNERSKRMNTIQELQKLREELIREIDEKFDWIIDEVKKESVPSRQKESRKPRNYEIIYPLNVGAGVFKGKRPTGVIFADGRRTENPTWKSVAEELLKDCCKDSDQRQALMDLRGKVLGRNRVLLGSETGKMRSPVKIDEALYIETHYDAETLMRILTTRILDMVGYDYSKIRIAVKAE